LDSFRHQATTRGVQLATEWLWCNFPPPVALHNFRHLGASYRERRRFKRLKSTNLPPNRQ
jgi:DNA adenine methylase